MKTVEQHEKECHADYDLLDFIFMVIVTIIVSLLIFPLFALSVAFWVSIITTGHAKIGF